MSDSRTDVETHAGQAGAESESASFVAYELWENPGFVLEPALAPAMDG
ncbi:MAG: hypothetical protein IPJ41_01880 [Phycisphaerales bacterium]|nr:hypothetical protein [Phycisphaerales bacterium]